MASISWAVTRMRSSDFCTLPSKTYFTPKSSLTCWTFMDFPLYVNVEFRAMTNISGIMDNAVMMFSLIPSARYSWSGSLLILTKGSTAMEGFSGSGKAISSSEAISKAGTGCCFVKCRFANIPATTRSIPRTIKTAHCPRCVRYFPSPIVLPLDFGSSKIR